MLCNSVCCCAVGQPRADRALLQIPLSMHACTTPDLFVCLLQSPPYLYTEAVKMTLALVQRATTAAHPEQSRMGCRARSAGRDGECLLLDTTKEM